MECWRILHLEPTQDKQAIKEAYMDKLSLFHPEEDPEGFKRLRQAYETALEEANKLLDEEVQDDSPSGIWLQKVKEIYKCFSKRIDTSYWEELLEDDVCYQLDMAEETSDKLLEFLMDNYRLPQPVWALLCERFNWFEKKEELLKKYPESFINFIFDESTYDYENAIIKYELFEGFDEADYDEWFRKFFDLRRAVNERNDEEAERILAEIPQLEIYHPEMECLKVRYLVQIKKMDEAREIINAVLEKYPNNASYLYSAGQIELFSENTALAREFYEKALEINPNHIGACEGLGECCFIEKDYENAEEYYLKVGNEYPYDEYVSSRIYDIKDNLVKQYFQKITDGEKDKKLLFKTAWLNFEIRDYEKAKEIFEMINPEKEEMEQYYDLQGRIFSELKDYQKAIESFEKMLDITQKEDAKAYVYKQLGIQYYDLKDYENAVKYYDKALEYEKDNVDLYNRKAVALFWQKKYQQSIEICDLGLEIDNRIAHLHVNKAKALYEIGNYSQAMDECEITNSIYPYFKDSYLIELKIFGEVGDFQRALDVVKQIDELEIEYWELEQYKGRVYNSLNDYENAEKSYLKALELNEANDCVLYDLAQTLNNKGDYEEALKNIEKSIKLQKEPYKYMLKGFIHKNMGQKPQAIRCYNYCIKMNYNPDYAENNKGRVFEEEEDYTNAMKCYKKALKINPNHPTVNNNIGELYEKLGEEQKALKYYNKQIEIEPDAYYFVNRAWCYSSLNDDEKAIEDFKSALDYEPDNIYAHNGLGISYKRLKRFEEAIEELKKVSQLDVANRFVYLYRDMGQCYEGLEDKEKAEEVYTLGIEKFSDNESLYLNRGLLYSNIGKPKEAIEDYKQVLKLNPRNSYAYNNIGAVYDDEQDYEKAIKYYKKALEINPEHDRANKNLANIYMDEFKDYSMAIKYYKKQIEVNFTGAYLYRRISEAYYKSKKYIKAKEYALMALKIYEKELKQNPQACTYRYIASCYRYMKKVEQAREFYNKAIECADKCEDCNLKQCHEAYCEIGEIYEEFENYEKALEYYEKASEIDKDSKEYKENIVRVRGKMPLK